MGEPIKSIERISPKPTDTIVLRFNEKATIEEMDFWYKHVQDKFPNNTIVALPDSVNLEVCGKEVWEDYIRTIYETVKAMP
jgi:hypothetical protein